MAESEGHTYAKEHQLSGKTLPLDLGAEAQSLLTEARQASNGRAARTLVKEGALRLTLLALKDGASVPEHRAGGPVNIQVITGRVAIGVAEANYGLGAQQSLVLEANVVHSVLAQGDAVILLTIAMAEEN